VDSKHISEEGDGSADAPVRVAVVTGAATGIGRACAQLLAGRGFHVIGAGRTASIDTTPDDLDHMLDIKVRAPYFLTQDLGMLRADVRASTEGLAPDVLDRVRVADESRMPLGRIADPVEVALTAVHLAVEATGTTGVDVPVDVGYMAS